MEECGSGAGRGGGRQRLDRLGGNEGSDGEGPRGETGERGGAGGGRKRRWASRHGGGGRQERRGAGRGDGSGVWGRGREVVEAGDSGSAPPLRRKETVTESFDVVVVG